MTAAFRMMLVAVLVALAALAGGVTVPFSDASSATTLTRGQTLFGMNVPSLAQLDASQSTVGVRAAIVGTFADWAHAATFPRQLAENASRRGAVLLISWEPWDSWRGGAEQPRYAPRTIAAGHLDALIERWADEIASYGRPV